MSQNVKDMDREQIVTKLDQKRSNLATIEEKQARFEKKHFSASRKGRKGEVPNFVRINEVPVLGSEVQDSEEYKALVEAFEGEAGTYDNDWRVVVGYVDDVEETEIDNEWIASFVTKIGFSERLATKLFFYVRRELVWEEINSDIEELEEALKNR